MNIAASSVIGAWYFIPPCLGFYRGWNYNNSEKLYTYKTIIAFGSLCLYTIPIIKPISLLVLEVPRLEAYMRNIDYKSIINLEDKN